MKNIIKYTASTLNIFFGLLILPNQIFAQNPPPLPVVGVEYSYDLNGNRVRRMSTLVLMKRGLEEDSAQVEATITAENKITVAPNPTTGILKVDIILI